MSIEELKASVDIWDARFDGAWRVIPTNLSVSSRGLAVMGRGLALDAADRFPSLSADYGFVLSKGDTTVLLYTDRKLVLFPVKRHWRDSAVLGLIYDSCSQLRSLFEGTKVKVVMPHVGCGYGHRNWVGEVRPIVVGRFRDCSFSVVVVHL